MPVRIVELQLIFTFCVEIQLLVYCRVGRLRTIAGQALWQLGAPNIFHWHRRIGQCRIRMFRCDSLSFDFRAQPCWRTDAKDMKMKMSVIEAVSFA